MTGVRPSRFAGRRKLAALYIVGAHQVGWGIATCLDRLVADPGDAAAAGEVRRYIADTYARLRADGADDETWQETVSAFIDGIGERR